MTNPDNAVGTNAAYGGRTSVNAFNDDLASYSRGVMSGWACIPSSGLTVALGGDSGVRDVAVAEDNAGNKVTINNISGTAIETTIDAAPASNSRIDAIVAYVDNPPQGSATITDNYEACGLIVVAGTAASSPQAPNDGAIRSAITADGASGATAYYAVLATVTVASGTTDITANDIAPGASAGVQARNLNGGAQPAETVTGEYTAGSSYSDMPGTFTLPSDGLYYLGSSINSRSAGQNKFLSHIRAYCGSTLIIPEVNFVSSQNYATNNTIQGHISSVFYGKAGDVVKLQVYNQNHTSVAILHNSILKQIA